MKYELANKNLEDVVNSFKSVRAVDIFLRRQGWTFRRIAELRGVSPKAVWMNVTSWHELNKKDAAILANL